MTALTHRSTLRGPANGGVAARRAVIRWAWRMFRREWRRQLLVIALLTVAVAAAIGSVTIAYNSAAADNAEFGSANHLIRFDGANPEELDAGLAAARERFGTTDVIRHRTLEVPGSVDPVEFRSQDPRGPYGDARLALQRGSYPEGPGDVAVTDGVATLLGLEIGDPLSLDGRRRGVVGIVENPLDLSDEFALVTPSSAEAPDEVSVLVDAGAGSVDAFVQSPAGANERSAFRGTEERQDDQEASALAMFSVATVFLLLASLVASAGFAVIAQRRLRQLGALAAIGATEKHLRLVLLTGGAVVGAIGALPGAIVGLALWLALIPTLEPAVGHRIDPLSLPWTLLVATVFVAVLGATAAAWWPGRVVARVPVTLALSARPPRPRPTHHSTLLAAITLALGIAAAVVIVAEAEERQSADERPNLSDRQIRVYAGSTFGPEVVAIRTRPELERMTGGVRQLAAGLDGAAVIPLHNAYEPGVWPTNNNGIRERLTEVLSRKIDDPDSSRWSGRAMTCLGPARCYVTESHLYVARPAVLGYLGIDPAAVQPGTDFLIDRSVATDELLVVSEHSAERAVEEPPVTELAVDAVQRIDSRKLFGSPEGDTGLAPTSFVTLDGLRRLGWSQIPSGWLVESRRPLTSEQIADARELAADAGLTIETQRESASLAELTAIAIAAGALLALGILAMTVGLIRGESAGDLRTLTATGATSRIRRTLTATTAGALALLGALLGVAGAYVALVATYLDDLGYLGRIPVLYLVLMVVGVP